MGVGVLDREKGAWKGGRAQSHGGPRPWCWPGSTSTFVVTCALCSPETDGWEVMQELPLGPTRREKDEPDRDFLEGEGFTSKRERESLLSTHLRNHHQDTDKLLASPTQTQSCSAKQEGLTSTKMSSMNYSSERASQFTSLYKEAENLEERRYIYISFPSCT